jgi:hypothetical protein
VSLKNDKTSRCSFIRTFTSKVAQEHRRLRIINREVVALHNHGTEKREVGGHQWPCNGGDRHRLEKVNVTGFELSGHRALFVY